MSLLEIKCCYKALTSCKSNEDVPTLSVFSKKARPTPVKSCNWIYQCLLQLLCGP